MMINLLNQVNHRENFDISSSGSGLKIDYCDDDYDDDDDDEEDMDVKAGGDKLFVIVIII